MKMSDVASYVKIFTMPEQKSALHRQGRHQLSQIQILEYHYACVELVQFIDNAAEGDELDDRALHELSLILEKRWLRIMRTNSAYLSDTTNPANQLYSTIATELQRMTSAPRYRFLMPTLKRDESSITLKNLADCDMRHSDFVLTDDASDFIELLPCLKIYADTENFLATNVDAGLTARELSETEIERIVNHSDQTEQYVKAVKEIHRIKNSIGTIGFALRELSLQLRQGSVMEDGEEYVAGSSAHLAVHRFSESLKELAEVQLADLMKRSFRNVVGEQTSFGYVWSILTRDKLSRASNAATCVKTLSEQIDEILKNNLDLHTIKIGSGNRSTIDLDYCKQKLDQAEKKLAAFYRYEVPVKSFIYPPENDDKMFSVIISDVNSHPLLTQVKLIPLYRSLSDENKNKLVLALLNLGVTGGSYIVKQVSRFNQLREIMETLDEENKLRLLKQTDVLNKLLKPKDKKRKATHIDDLVKLLELFENKKAVLDLISAVNLDLYRDYPEISLIMDETSHELDQIIELQLVLSADEARDFLAAEQHSEEPPHPTALEARQTPFNVSESTVISLVSSNDEEEKEPEVVERKNEDAMDLDEVAPTETEEDQVPVEELAKEPPLKRIRRSSDDREEAVPVSVASSHLTLFSSASKRSEPTRGADLYAELRLKANRQQEKRRPLEALHYLKRSYDCLISPRHCAGADPQWKTAQVESIKQGVHLAIKTMSDDWTDCFMHYETEVERHVLDDWRKTAMKLASKLLREPQDQKALMFLKGAAETLSRPHPQFHAR